MKNRLILFNSPRNSNIELLRILSMLMIIAHHFCMYSGFDYNSMQFSINRLLIDFLYVGGKIGTNIFILISGFYLINSSSLRKKKILLLWAELFFYSIVLFSVSIFISPNQPITLKRFLFEIYKSFTPIMSRTWWFASVYFILYLLSPFLNKFLKSIDKKTYKSMLVLLTIIWCVIPTFTITNSMMECNQLLWFIYLYCLSGYIRLHSVSSRKDKLFWMKGAIMSLLITYITVVLFMIIGIKIDFFAANTRFFYIPQSFLLLLVSVFLFLYFKELKPRNNIIINALASSVFGVYLIHDFPRLRVFLWKEVVHAKSFQDNYYLIFYGLFAIVLIYFVCSFVDLIRKNSLELVLKRFLDRQKPLKLAIIIKKHIKEFRLFQILEK